MRPRIPRTVHKPPKRVRKGDSRVHLALIRTLPCCVCYQQAEPHHLLGQEFGHGTGMKSLDRWTIPLCRIHHDGAHAAGNDEEYLTELGIDTRQLAARLWHVSKHIDDLDERQRLAERAVRRAKR